jgi:hypothetical protein
MDNVKPIPAAILTDNALKRFGSAQVGEVFPLHPAAPLANRMPERARLLSSAAEKPIGNSWERICLPE